VGVGCDVWSTASPCYVVTVGAVVGGGRLFLLFVDPLPVLLWQATWYWPVHGVEDGVDERLSAVALFLFEECHRILHEKRVGV
jgi:hypothetical protein